MPQATLALPMLCFTAAGTQPIGTDGLILATFAVVFLVATWAVLVRTTRKSQR